MNWIRRVWWLRNLGQIIMNLLLNLKTVDMLPKLVSYFDEPFADSSALPTFMFPSLPANLSP